ncbi:MAG: DNA polymerase III subunit alpha [Bacteroidetes bacterium]|nr:DNA polymerase III subunit alpha [Bacteroidota bacterium]
MLPLLNLHSNFSFGWGASDIEGLCRRARDLGYDTIALTDINNLYILFLYYETARTFGLRAITGVHLKDSVQEISAYVKNAEGFANLTQLVSRLQEDKKANLRLLLPLHAGGLIFMTPSVELAEFLKVEGGIHDVYLQIDSFHIPLIKLRRAKKSGVRPIAAHPVYMVKKDNFLRHQVLKAIRDNKTLSQLSPTDLISEETYLLPPDELIRRFEILPEAVDNLTAVARDLTWSYPPNQLFKPRYLGPAGSSPFDHLRKLTYEGAVKRYGRLNEAIVSRIEKELTIIEAKSFSEYFLTVSFIVKQSSSHCGRGSAAASIIAYCLNITDVEPIRHNLFFERFLNMRRDDPPDIDVDFCWDERDDIIDTLFQTYGTDYCAMVCNHVLYKDRMAIREVAKVFGIPEMEIQAFFHRIPMFSQYYGSHGVETFMASPQAKGLSNQWKSVLQISSDILGFPRYISVHAGGFVITEAPIRTHAPLEPAPKGIPVVQWEKDQTEDSGLIKIDILGNRSLAVIRDIKRSVYQHYGHLVDFETFDVFTDQKTLDMLGNGKSMGVFYVESPAMRQLQEKTRLGDFDHLTIHSSIIRPAANKFITEYVRRVKGGDWEPIHPLLADQLSETYGIMCYQEDVIKAGMTLADMDEYDATKLLKSLSRKNDNEMKIRYKQLFMDGCRSKGLTQAKTDEIWDMIHSFAGYSFNKPHSASYVVVSFHSAYMKAHFPAEFIAAVISNQGGFYSPFGYISEARRMGISILLPDINDSMYEYTGYTFSPGTFHPENGKTAGLDSLLNENRISYEVKKPERPKQASPQLVSRDFPYLRVGFMQIKNLTKDYIVRVLGDRQKRGKFTSMSDLINRTSPQLSDLQILIKSGSLDSINQGKTRPELMWEAELHYSRSSVQVGDCFDLFETPALPPPPVPDYPYEKVIEDEMLTLDFVLSVHPLFLFKRITDRLNHIPGSKLHLFVGKRVRTIGWMITRKVVYTKNDEPMQFVSFEDTTAIYETVFFPEAYAKFCTMLSTVKPYKLYGLVMEDFSAITLQVEKVEFLDG